MTVAEKRLAELGEASPLRLLVRYSWPALVSATLNSLYAVVDRFYIGHGCGEDAMAGLTLAFPLMMAFGAIGPLIGVGHFSILSIRLGENDRVGAEKMLGQMMFMKLAFAAVVPALVFVLIDPLLRLTGGGGVTEGAFACARTYLQIVIFSEVFSHIAFGLSGMMRAEGNANVSMACMVVGFGLNLLLDPLFIFGFGLGIAGAAWATDVAMFASCAVALWYYVSGRSAVKLRWRRIRVYRGETARPLAIGLAPFLSQIASAMIVISMQLAFAKWCTSAERTTMQLASLGVFLALTAFAVMPIFGIQQGLAPIIGYNWGAKNFGRVRNAVFSGLGITTVACVAACLIQVVFAEPIAACFTDGTNPEFVKQAGGDLRLSNMMLWCISLNVVATTYYQAISRPKTAIFLSLLRQVVCLIPLIWFLPYCFDDHVFAIWLAMPLSDVAACLATLPPFLINMRYLRIAALHRQKTNEA